MSHLADRLRVAREANHIPTSSLARRVAHSIEEIRANRQRTGRPLGRIEGLSVGSHSGGSNAGRPSGSAEDGTASTSDERIAFVVDSCCDVPESYRELFPFFVAPMTVTYDDGSTYLDGINITADEMYARFPDDIPHTSAPTPASVHDAFAQAAQEGYTHIVGVTISSGLSASCMVFEQVACEFPQLKVEVVDSLNIGAGAGMIAMLAAEMLEAGCSFDEIVREARAVVPRTHVFFVVDSLEYLYRGGRVGAAVYRLGSTLNIRPIITCDETGRYVVCGKVRGRKKSLAKAVSLARASEVPGSDVRVLIVDAQAEDEKHEMLAKAATLFPNGETVSDGGHISPALTVHTGPGLIGVLVQSI